MAWPNTSNIRDSMAWPTGASRGTPLSSTGMRELHLMLIQERLKRRDKVEVETKEPKIPYRETIQINCRITSYNICYTKLLRGITRIFLRNGILEKKSMQLRLRGLLSWHDRNWNG